MKIPAEDEFPPEASPDYCYYCNQIEPWDPGKNFRYCGECMHVYKSKEELENEFDKLIERKYWWERFTKRKIPAALIYACPKCGHDF